MENWKRIKSFTYDVSDMGRVRNSIGEVLQPFKLKTGIRAVFLRKKDKYHLKTVSQLVAKAFLPNPEDLRYVDYIDGNKENLKFSNLKWVKSNGNAKLSPEAVNHIRTSKLKYKHLQELYHISKSTIQKIKQGVIWVK